MILRGKRCETEVQEGEECTGGRVRGRGNEQAEAWWLERRAIQKMFELVSEGRR